LKQPQNELKNEKKWHTIFCEKKEKICPKLLLSFAIWFIASFTFKTGNRSRRGEERRDNPEVSLF